VLQHITIYFKMHCTAMLILNGGVGLDSMPDDKILVLVSRTFTKIGLGLETWLPRDCSWSQDLVIKVLVYSFDNKSEDMPLPVPSDHLIPFLILQRDSKYVPQHSHFYSFPQPVLSSCHVLALLHISSPALA